MRDQWSDFQVFLDRCYALPASQLARLISDVLGERKSRSARVLRNQLAMVCEEIWRGNVDDETLDDIFAAA